MRSSPDRQLNVSPQGPRAFVLGGNASTIAFVTGLPADEKLVTAHLVPMAQTPIGTVLGDAWQNVGIAFETLLDWIDQTFPPEDERAFVAPVRDVELLARVHWQAEAPARLDAESVLNVEDLPDDVAEAAALPPESLVQCAVCRRLCVRDHFVWKERRLCAWDYHAQVFGKRGPWHDEPYESRHFETVPEAAYVVPALLEEAGADVVLAIAGVDDEIAREAVNLVVRAEAGRPHLAVRTPDGYTLLRER